MQLPSSTVKHAYTPWFAREGDALGATPLFKHTCLQRLDVACSRQEYVQGRPLQPAGRPVSPPWPRSVRIKTAGVKTRAPPTIIGRLLLLLPLMIYVHRRGLSSGTATVP